MAYQYAKPGPPFPFLGNLAESQKNAFAAWTQARMQNFPAIQLHHQVRAQQLRKTAGMLEAYYATLHIEPLQANFQKETWKAGPYGHWHYSFRNDHLPAATVAKVKRLFQHQLERQDEGIFHMLHLRNQIEVQEDRAQYAADGQTQTVTLMNKLESLFGRPEYATALVKDVTNLYKGEPYHRVNQMDPPTRWELEQHNHGDPDSTIYLKGQTHG